MKFTGKAFANMRIKTDMLGMWPWEPIETIMTFEAEDFFEFEKKAIIEMKRICPIEKMDTIKYSEIRYGVSREFSFV